ncbi:Na(+)/H(+) antiporter subunit C [Nocardioides solisilvae]|uniref:Na(+)/H(+) antiporter subunit C n=1 Tax=Nocardioides solisilvae TaxID=1542435 RepID=UPI000D74D092|nr:Na(+)/H(+) antiporter subunit C [Nocardioides solisilvae]
MTDVNLTLVLTSAGLIGCGVYLLLERSLSRVLVGLLMMGNGVSLAFLVAGGPGGAAPITVEGVDEPMSDPLPQAMVLTAIVIMLATTSFVLAMAYRSWQLTGHDDVQDDVEDAMIRRMAATDATSEAFSAASDDPDEVEESSDFAEGELVDGRGDEPGGGQDLGADVAAEHEREETRP